MSSDAIVQGLQSVIQTEIDMLTPLLARVTDDLAFCKAVECLKACQGRIIVSGMGKSGHIARKIAATLASTGSPAFFVHPAEAGHGDMGMITEDDVVLLLSNSGSTPELMTLLPQLRQLKVSLIAMTGKPISPLAQAAHIHLDASVSKEACVLNLAPTASTTVALVLGDAMAIVLSELRGFTPDDFARSHPSGALGRRLLLNLDDLMRKDSAIPSVSKEAPLTQALLEMSEKGLGLTTIQNEAHALLGIFTDGDLRRLLDQGINVHDTLIADVMNTVPKTIQSGLLAVEALTQMEMHKITALVVLDDAGQVQGVLHLHDLLSAGLSA